MPHRPWHPHETIRKAAIDSFQRQGNADASPHKDGSISITPTFWDSRAGRFVKRAGLVTGITTLVTPLAATLANATNSATIHGVEYASLNGFEWAARGALAGLALSAVGALFIPFMQTPNRFAKERYEKDHDTKLLPTNMENRYIPVPKLGVGESLVLPNAPTTQRLESGAVGTMAGPQVIGANASLPSAYVVDNGAGYGGYGGGFGGGFGGGRGGFWDGAGDYLLYSTIFDGLSERRGYGGSHTVDHHHYYNGRPATSATGMHSASSKRPNPFQTFGVKAKGSRLLGGGGSRSRSSRSSRSRR